MRKSWKRLAVVATVFMFLITVLPSCSQTPIETSKSAAELVMASFAVSDDRALYAQVDTDTVYYTYTAEPLFTLESPAELVGRRTTETQIGENGSVPTASLGYFTAGRWTFHIWAYNAARQLVRQGETTIYLRKTADGISNTIPITLYRNETMTGNVSFAIITNNVSSSGANFSISYSRNNGAFTAETFLENTCETVTWNQKAVTNPSGFGLMVSEIDGQVHVRGRATSGGTLVLSQSLVNGHKYYVNASYGLDGTGSRNIDCSAISLPSTSNSAVLTAGSDGYITKTISSGTDYDFVYKISVVDLTQMYGSGSEPSKEDFERMFPKAWYSYANGEVINKTVHTFRLDGLPAGAYVFDVKLYDGTTLIGGAAVATYVLGKIPAEDTTVVTGRIYASDHISASFSITIPDAIVGTVGAYEDVGGTPAPVFMYQVNGAVNTETTFIWDPATGSGQAVRYCWYRDGVLVQDSTSNTAHIYKWRPTTSGAFSVTCVAYSASGFEVGSSSVLLNVPSMQSTFSMAWDGPNASHSVNFVGNVGPSSLVRLHVTYIGGATVYSGYPTFTYEDGHYTSVVTLPGGQKVTLTLVNGSLTMTPSGNLSQMTVRVEGRP